jgi:ubiquinone/menaquinone biosynthesis C-methylase UbiE
LYSNAAGYESYMGRWSARLAPDFLRFACSKEPKFMLDVGSGTGSLIRAATINVPLSRVVGLDPYFPYLLHASATTGSSHAEFVTGRIEALPFADGTFDHCLSLLVLQEIEDRAQAMSEMYRVTSRDGIVAACQWDFGEGMPVIAAVRAAIKAIAPSLYESTNSGTGRAFASLAELQQYWTSAGLEDIETTLLTVTLSYENFADFWSPLLSGSTPMTALVASLPSDAREAVSRRLRETLIGGNRDCSFSLTAQAFAIRGRAFGQTALGLVPGRLDERGNEPEPSQFIGPI